MTANSLPARAQQIYRGSRKLDQKHPKPSMQSRMPGSRLRPRNHRGGDLVGGQFGSASEQCSLEEEYPAQPAVSETRMATNALCYQSNTSDGRSTALK